MPTDDLKQRIAAMKEAAEKATAQWTNSALAGAYVVDPQKDYVVLAAFGEYTPDGILETKFDNAVANKTFVVKCCPANVLALIAEVERLERENRELSAHVTFLCNNTEHTIPLDEVRKRR